MGEAVLRDREIPLQRSEIKKKKKGFFFFWAFPFLFLRGGGEKNPRFSILREQVKKNIYFFFNKCFS